MKTARKIIAFLAVLVFVSCVVFLAARSTLTFFLYCILMDDIEEAYHRIECWKEHEGKVLPFAQPFRDPYNPNQIIPQWQKDMAHWADRKELYMSCDFKDFEPRKGFYCREYF